MKLVLTRKTITKVCTIGELSVDGKFECYTLEDIPRECKVYSETCIPKGEYEVVITMSNRFKQRMPLLKSVPGFEGIRIHSGNTAADTEGCILVGMSKGKDIIYESRKAYKALFDKLDAALAKGEKVTIKVQ